MSLLLAAAGWFADGPVADAVFLIGLLAALGALVLWVTGVGRRRRLVIVDGSNVLHWRNGTPDLKTVAEVVDRLRQEGWSPVVWFDANVGYKVGSRYLGSAPLARALDLPARDVRVAPSGTPADPLILSHARRARARVVTNDRFRDWGEDYPAVASKDFLIRGRARNDGVTLDL